MKTLRFANGDQMPVLGLGTWKSSPGEVHSAVIEALRMGYRHIDCAAVYDNEAEVGSALKEAFAEGIVTREELWITSKLWCDQFAPGDVLPACQETLQDLQLDYLDLYLMHWPFPLKKGHGIGSADDFVSPVEQPLSSTWKVMETLVEQGLSRHIGVSNFSVKKLKDLIGKAAIKPEMNQVEMHPYLQQPELVSFCRENNIHVTGYSPLGSPDRPEGLKSKNEVPLLEDKTVAAIAEKHNASPAQVLLSWAMHYGISTIPKSVNPVRIRQNLEATKLSLDDSDQGQLAQLDKHGRFLSGEFWVVDNGYYTLADIWDE